MNAESIIFIIYLVFMLGIGIYFFLRDKNASDKGYFLGGRQMGAWVTALSAGASDMSAWVLMGLPAAIYEAGMGKTWIAIGLLIGYAVSWFVVAPRLRSFTIAAGDSITVPQYLTNRFLSKSRSLQLICALVFLVAYTIYSASSIKACSTLFHMVLGMRPMTASTIAAVIIIGYTFLGGFNAVCWTDFFQGLLMLGALLCAPIVAVFVLDKPQTAALPAHFWSFLSTGSASWKSFADILTGLGWGLGYFGMPHIIVRFMSLRSGRELKKSRRIGIGWTLLILLFSVAAACVGRIFIPDAEDSSVFFIMLVRKIFSGSGLGLITGLLLSAILAASMSTPDSQLLAASSSFTCDVYEPILRKGKAGAKESAWVGRLIVALIAIVAYIIVAVDKTSTIMGLVENAWGVFGAAFGPVILLSLFWKRFTYRGAVAGIVAGAAVDIIWLAALTGVTGIYEIIPGFAVSLAAGVIVSRLDKAPSKEVEAIFERGVATVDD